MNISGLPPPTAAYAAAASARGTTARGSAPAGQLTPDQQAQLDQLKARDREVRQHEQAHLSAAAGLAVSGASFAYQKGPDGVNYAVGGEVRIDTSPGRTPEETLQRAQTIRAAALAPADPSGQDRAVAAKAASMAQEARSEIAAEQQAAPDDARAARVARHYAGETRSSSGFSAYA